MVIYIQIGDDHVDTDAQSSITFQYVNPIFSTDAGTRSIEISVPDTHNNNRIFGYGNNPDMPGVRTQCPCMMVLPGGVNIMCSCMYMGYTAGRHNIVLLFTQYQYALDYKLDTILTFRQNTLAVERQNKATVSGQAEPYGWYMIYNDYSYPIDNTSWSGTPLLCPPAANLGYILRTALDPIELDTSHTDWDPEQFALILPSANTRTWRGLRVRGSGVNGWNIVEGAPSWEQAGFELVGQRYKRGAFGANKTIICMRAIRPLKIEVDEEWEDYIYSTGQGETILTELQPKDGGGTWFVGRAGGYSFTLAAGEYFSVALNSDSVEGWWHRYWKAHAFEDEIEFAFRIVEAGEQATVGNIISLSDNLPDLTAQQLLDAWRDITGVVLLYDPRGGQISAYDWEHVRTEAAKIKPINMIDNDIISIDNIYRYIDGYARDNIYRTNKEAETDGDIAGYTRHVHVYNDILEPERVAGDIPLAAGVPVPMTVVYPGGVSASWIMPYLNNCNMTESGGTIIGGYTFVIWTGGTHTGGDHLNSCLAAGMGAAINQWATTANTIEVRFFLNVGDFLRFSPFQPVQILGNTYLIMSGTWSDGIAQLTLVSL